ncbi:MAG: TetR/AcrR family transcriptional regulator [Lachnospiraceae bacterium]|nr:TetR/AcrR family transcriptional regulator [Lachnospiraceae bacterium]
MEILETAMSLFIKKGYENTSMLDISKEMKVSQGLCYRYFNSKAEIYETALQLYTDAGVEAFKKVICNSHISILDKIDSVFDVVSSNQTDDEFYQFYHQEGNTLFHEQLLINLCDKLIPILAKELEFSNIKGDITIENSNAIASFCLYGQLGIWNNQNISEKAKKELTKELIIKILGL